MSLVARGHRFYYCSVGKVGRHMKLVIGCKLIWSTRATNMAQNGPETVSKLIAHTVINEGVNTTVQESGQMDGEHDANEIGFI